MEEIDVLVRCNRVLGVSHDEMLGGISFAATMMTLQSVESIVKRMDNSKQIILEECMKKMMEADGPANETEIGTWWGSKCNLTSHLGVLKRTNKLYISSTLQNGRLHS